MDGCSVGWMLDVRPSVFFLSCCGRGDNLWCLVGSLVFGPRRVCSARRAWLLVLGRRSCVVFLIRLLRRLAEVTTALHLNTANKNNDRVRMFVIKVHLIAGVRELAISSATMSPCCQKKKHGSWPLLVILLETSGRHSCMHHRTKRYTGPC